MGRVGAVANQQSVPAGGGVDFERIRPGMSPDEMERVRQEIARVASQTLRGTVKLIKEKEWQQLLQQM